MGELQEGQAEALDELYRRYARKLYLFCSHALSPRDPEALVHDAFLRVIEAAGRFDPEKGSFRTWLFGIARHRGIDLIRREGRVSMRSLETPPPHPGGRPRSFLAETVGGGEPGAPEAAMQGELREAVRSCLEELGRPEERQALVLYYMGSKVFREIGEILGKSTSMAQKLVRAAKARVKRCLEGKGVDP